MEQNLSQYKIFYEVAKAGNISKAAKELYISQPLSAKPSASWRTAWGFLCSPEAPGAYSLRQRGKFSLNIQGKPLTPLTGERWN